MLLRLPSPFISSPLRLRFVTSTKPPGTTTIPHFINLSSCREWKRRVRYDRKSVGFVPIMGALHAGQPRPSLETRERRDSRIDLRQPSPVRTPRRSLHISPNRTRRTQIGRDGGVDAVFLPGAKDMYPSGIVQNVEQQRAAFVKVKGCESSTMEATVGCCSSGESRPWSRNCSA